MSMVGIHCENRCTVADNTSSVSGATRCDAVLVPLLTCKRYLLWLLLLLLRELC
jgi:hypothetical protein